ncbi:radical SAM protein [bacterium]|nr:radical SAM protein [bacterium]MBU1753120.1 radical SAM protein [bacterium]
MRRKIFKFIRNLVGYSAKFPEEIQIEITNRCNLSCKMCIRDTLNIPLEDMPFETFEEIMKRLSLKSPLIKLLILTGLGEPLMHPRLAEMIALANKLLPNTMIQFTSNGFLLGDKNRISLAKLKVEKITISIELLPWSNTSTLDSHPPDQRVIENISSLSKSLKDTHIYLQTVMQRDGLKGLEEIIKFGSQIKAKAVNLVRKDTSYDPQLVRPSQENEKILIKQAKKLGRKYGIQVYCINDQHLLMRIAAHFDRVCLRTDNYIYIDVDGNVTPCCNLRNLIGGNILKEDLSIIWHGEKMQQFRKNQTKICVNCDTLKYKQRSNK